MLFLEFLYHGRCCGILCRFYLKIMNDRTYSGIDKRIGLGAGCSDTSLLGRGVHLAFVPIES